MEAYTKWRRKQEQCTSATSSTSVQLYWYQSRWFKNKRVVWHWK